MGFLNRKPEPAAPNKAAKELTILNRLGLHARPSAMFVKTASRFRAAEVWVEKDGALVLSGYRVQLLQHIAETGSLAEAAQRKRVFQLRSREVSGLDICLTRARCQVFARCHLPNARCARCPRGARGVRS